MQEAIKRENSCCFTGHRMEKLPWGGNESDSRCVALKEKIYDAVLAVYQSGMRHFICGMATGCDLYFCEAVMRLRGEMPGVTVEAAIPWEGQADRWPSELRRRYHRLVSECDFETLLQTNYDRSCLIRRNHYMVDHASLLIACFDGKPGGTMSTMLYAIRNKVEILEIQI